MSAEEYYASIINKDQDDKKVLEEVEEVSDGWICSSCEFKNPLNKKKCEACDTLAPRSGKIEKKWRCSQCNYENTASASDCNLCDTSREVSLQAQSNQTKQQETSTTTQDDSHKNSTTLASFPQETASKLNPKEPMKIAPQNIHTSIEKQVAKDEIITTNKSVSSTAETQETNKITETIQRETLNDCDMMIAEGSNIKICQE